MIYGAKHFANAFRTVRQNTIQIAEDIPEEKYDFRPAAEVRSIGEELAHVACATTWLLQMHGEQRKPAVAFEDFSEYMARVAAMEPELKTKGQIVEALRKHGEAFARFLEGLTDEHLAETVSFPPPVQPSTKTRFEMLLGAKEHEMHHRAKLMLLQRLIGQVPHLTQRRMQMQAQAQTARA